MSAELEHDGLELDGTPGSKAETARRLVKYAARFKRQLFWALLMLAVAVGTDLAGPLVAKTMIDTHISGIERSWFAASEPSPYSVEYEGALYKREDRFAENEPMGQEVRIVQVGRAFYFIEGAVAFDGARSVSDAGEVVIERGDAWASYPAIRLSREELFAFYRPELAGVIRLSGIYFILILISAAFTYGQRYVLQASANRIIRRMRMEVFAQINRLPIRYFDNLPAGKVVSRVTNDTEAVRELYVTVLANFFTGIVYMLGIFAALFILDVKLAAICLFIIPALAIWVYVYGKVAKRYNRIIRSTISEINGTVNESIQGMPIIQAFRRQTSTEREFEGYNERLQHYQNKLLWLNAVTGHNLVGLLRNAAFVALIWYFGGASLSGPEGIITLGVLYAFVDYLNRLFQPVVNIVNQLPNLETALVSAERVFRLMDEPGEDVSDQTLPRFKGLVRFEQVWFAYKENEYVLKGLDFEAKPGQTVALVGHTGSGKSSMMNLLFRFYDPDRGRITVDGADIREMPRQAMRRHIGIVLQDPYLFTGTIASNVSLDDPSITREQVEQALAAVGADRLLRHLPGGIDEPVTEKGSTLSAGQRQLISFARALVFDPAILILDEATSSIDTETEALIQNALEVVKQGRTTFIIAHRLSTIKNADLILVLDRGEIAERGDQERLMMQRGKYYRMYQTQTNSAYSQAN